ncbi:hypothetical protein ALGA_2838 [Labilibaculum antarcticum]|uniref:Cardiolipin synthase N-terminal domain-containing protein n=1 Tax=Labilibaculum antarcticum TaxID=1717717 RepID=A0A1Y1CM90_9BACT|nr:hypothetical protein ALGA_2838 [Labilibaculum antarcticum]
MLVIKLKIMILLGIPGKFQLFIGLMLILCIVIYAYAFIKVWKSSMDVSHKLIYSLILILFPFLGLILVYVLMRKYYISINKL